MSLRPAPLHLRVFISSPGDVAEERAVAHQVLDRLPYDPLLREKITLQVIAWDKPGGDTPMLATMTPQEAINQGLPTPGQCDIMLVIFWSRMGTPLPDSYQKPGGGRYLSGTEWEYLDAVQASETSGRPFVVVYRRSEQPTFPPPGDPSHDAKLTQWQRVQDFFAAFNYPDGSIKQGYNSYQTPEDFREKLETHLKVLLDRLLTEHQTSEMIAADQPVIELWPGSPFPGLRAFTPADAPIFFGRGRETDELVRRLRTAKRRLLAVVGASGSGKSSLVGAGLLPRLSANAIDGSKDWTPVQFSPGQLGDNPFTALATALKRTFPDLEGRERDICAKLEANPPAIIDQVEAALINQPRWAKVLLFVDQFEELFTLINANHREPFLVLLEAAVESHNMQVVLTLRADFYGRCVEHPRLAALLEDSTYPLPAPGPSQLFEMISHPAARAGLTFEDGLIERILSDTGTEPGALALMAFALDELYRASAGAEVLTIATYEQLGGVQGAIGTRAENIYQQLDTEAQAAFNQVFREIVEVDERGVAIRRRAGRPQVASTQAAARLIDGLTAGRLLVQSRGDEDQPIVEVAHEALLRNWTRLVQWIEMAEDELRFLRQLRNAARDWEHSQRDPAYLLTGSRLEEAVVWLRNNTIEAGVQTLIETSQAAHQQRQAEEQARQARELEMQRQVAEEQRRSANRLRFIAAGLVLFLVVAVGLSIFAFDQQQEAEDQRQDAEAARQDAQTQAARAEFQAANAQTSEAIAETQAAEARSQSTAAAIARADAETQAAIAVTNEAIAEQNKAEAQSLLWANSARTVLDNGDHDLALALALAAVGVDDPPLIAKDALAAVAFQHSRVRTFSGHSGAVNSVAFSPDGSLALSASIDNTLMLWDVATGEPLRVFEGHADSVRDVAFSPDGSLALSGSWDGEVILWDVASGEPIRGLTTFGGTRVYGVAFNHDGTRAIACLTDQPVMIWDVATGEVSRTLPSYLSVSSVAVSHDGSLVAGGLQTGEVVLWDMASGEEVGILEGQNSYIQDLAFSPDDRMIIGGSDDSSVVLWGVESRQLLYTFTGHSANVYAVAFSPDGRTALSGSEDGTAILWDVVRGGAIRSFVGHQGRVNSVAFSPDGLQALTGSGDGSLILWDLGAASLHRSFDFHSSPVTKVALSSDGTRILSGTEDGTITVWDAASGDLLRLLTQLQGPVRGLAFSPDGDMALIGARYTAMTAWNLESWQAVHTFSGYGPQTSSLAYSPDGTTALGCSCVGGVYDFCAGGQVALWDLDSGEAIIDFRGHPDWIYSVVYSPDGTTALTGSCGENETETLVACAAGEMTLWDLATGEPIRTFSGHSDRINDVAFSPDGATALSASFDNTLILWDLATGEPLRTFSGHTDGVTGVEFGPDGRWAISSSYDGTLILWDVATGEPIRTFAGHGGGVHDVALSADGSIAVSGADDNSVVLWQVTTFDELVEWIHENREVIDLSCEQRARYRVEPLCPED